MLEDGGKWGYGYDPMGQVISGQKKTAAGADVPGMAFGYAFDGIGNRTSATVNGRTGTYTADAANQYTRRQVPGALDIRGRAHMAAKVTVNQQAVQRLDEYFYKALAVDNSAAPQYPGVSVLAVRGHAGPNGEDLQSRTTGHLYLAKSPETFTHDAEGNLTQDGRWTYTWDGENRLIRMETLAAVPAAAKRRLEFAYDSENRRVRKQVSHWNGGAWTLQSDRRYLYDGWNPVAELDASNTMLRNFVWGLDLSGSPQGAGGVGGLLAIREGAESHLPCYDGNGNVMALVRGSDRTVSARYEYGPFGETLAVEENGVSNPFRFSTKFLDGESGLLYYGYRYYDPVTGRWPSRDPIEENGGMNLYGFAGNDGINKWDIYGMLSCCHLPDYMHGPPARYDEKTHCCIKGEIIEGKLVSIGVARNQNFKDPKDLTPTHAWLEFPGGSVGFWRGTTGPLNGPGRILSPDPYVSNPKKQQHV